MRQFLRLLTVLLAGISLVLLTSVSMQGQELAKRLILKDGSYQTATKWEVKGDRVRYLSAERFEWEELPKNLVDWPATEKFNSAADKPDLNVKAVTEEAEREHKQQEEASPEVAAGLRLPSAGGVFLLDTFSNSPQLAELVQTVGEINKQTSRNVLRAAINPLATAK